MSEKNDDYDDNRDYDAFQEALSYGTVETSSLFEPDNKSYKIGTGGYRVKRASLIGLAVFFLVSAAIAFMIWSKTTWMGDLTIPFLFVFVMVMSFAGFKLGDVSPTKKTTGEDALTYFMMLIRMRAGSRTSIFFGKKPSVVKLNSLAIGTETGGRIVDCDVYLGTQPLYDAPPINPYDVNLMSEFRFDTSGEMQVLPSERYNDGVNRKL